MLRIEEKNMSCLPVEQIYSTGHLAERLGVSRNQVVRTIHNSVITPTKINGRWALDEKHAQILSQHFFFRMANRELSRMPRSEVNKDHLAA